MPLEVFSFYQTKFIYTRFIGTSSREPDDAKSLLIELFRRKVDIVLVGLKPA